MKELKRLKTMRDEAWTRIKDTDDYKLASRLDTMIPNLEGALENSPPLANSKSWKEARPN